MQDQPVRNQSSVYSLPRWSITQWLVDAGPDVPTDIRVALIQSLYGTLPIFAGGVINTIAVSVLIATRLPRPSMLAWAALEILLCGARLFVLILGHRAAARGRQTPTDVYILLGVLWAFSVGYGAFISVTSGDWVAATLACLSAAAMVGGICFRNFGAPRLVAVMILLSLGPCALGAVLSGEPILLIVAFQIPFYLVSMTIAAFRLNRLLVTTMQAERENEYRARHDALTGLSNRTGLLHALEARSPGKDRPLTLFYLDLDGFKTVNDSYGHAAGDQLLKVVASRLQRLVPPGDVVARIGGDEFVIISTTSERQDALRFGDSIIAGVSGTDYDVGDGIATIGVSIGIALLPQHGENLETLLRSADTALYDAKSRGGACCSIAAGPKPRVSSPSPVDGIDVCGMDGTSRQHLEAVQTR